jgi:hypothetical protein
MRAMNRFGYTQLPTAARPVSEDASGFLSREMVALPLAGLCRPHLQKLCASPTVTSPTVGTLSAVDASSWQAHSVRKLAAPDLTYMGWDVLSCLLLGGNAD